MKHIRPKQMELLRLIQDGWEISVETGMNPSARIQNGGSGRGGEAKGVHWNTFSSMRDNGLIAHNQDESPYSLIHHYRITQKGLDVLRGKNGTR